MRGRLPLLLPLLLPPLLSLLLPAACTRRTEGACLNDGECLPDQRCALDLNRCVPRTDGGGTDADAIGTDAGDTGGPECTGNQQCTAPKAVCDVPAGACVQCLGNGDCSGTTPICDAKACRACRADSDCAGEPGVCMEDGHCATAGEVIYVDYDPAGCASDADGTNAKPFCSLGEGTSRLAATRSVMIVRGGSDGRLVLNTPSLAPVIVGRANASITAGPGIGIHVMGGDVLVRDLLIQGGSEMTSKGVVASGLASKVRLRRVKIGIGMGLGVEANSGAELQMESCLVESNMGGGVLLNGASYLISNSVIAMNAYGVRFTAATVSSTSDFRFNTIVLNSTAVICDPANPRTLVGSIVAGANTDCVLDHSLTTAPTFDASRAYRLTSALPCPGGDPATFPARDIDGDPRTAPVDCGADEFVP